MSSQLDGKLVIAISSRALFNLDDSHQLYEKQGVKTYADYQVAHEEETLSPGVAFHLVKKLLQLKDNQQRHLVEVILLSRNSADTGLRIFNSIEHHSLNITRAAFCNGRSPYRYVEAFGAHLFLSANPSDVTQALQSGCAAAVICKSTPNSVHDDEIRIAFDGDAVLFSDEAERIYQKDGLESFAASEKEQAKTPLMPGPFKKFLTALHHIQNQFQSENCPVRTALVTARSAPAHERVVRTLRHWGIRIDEALFLGGVAKGDFLRAFNADFYFDDQTTHCDATREHVATGHVPHGVMNETV
jgi:5'-nucleotidase